MAVVFALTIGGVAKQIKAGSYSKSKTANGLTTVRFSVISETGVYRPAIDSDVQISVNGVVDFGGLVDRPTEKGLAAGAKPGIVTEISATDYTQYFQRRIIPDGGFPTAASPAGYTLGQALTALDAWVTPYGASLDPAQDAGPVLPELVYKYKDVLSVLNELTTVTGKDGEPYVLKMSPTKVWGMYQASTVAAPFNVTTDNPPQVVGDITIESKRDGYANRIYLRTPTKSETGRVETFTGDGLTTTFTPVFTVTKPLQTVSVTSNPNETLNFTGDADAATWTFDKATNSYTRNAGAPGVGEVVSITFDGVYSGTATAEDASAFTSPWERVVDIDDVPTDTTLQALADAELAKRLPLVRTVKYMTFEAGLDVGQEQTINVPRRNINATGIITDINTRDVGKDLLQHEVTVLFDAQNNLSKGFRDTVKKWNDTGSGASQTAAAVGAGTPISAGAAPPVTAVQFNDAGRFGGKSSFTFDKTTENVMVGPSHAPGSAYNLLVGEGHTVAA
jgi:hypothetical protein